MSESAHRFSGRRKLSPPCDQRSMSEGSLGGLLALTLSLDQTSGDKSGDTCRQSTEHSINVVNSGDTCRGSTDPSLCRTPPPSPSLPSKSVSASAEIQTWQSIQERCNATEFLTRQVIPHPHLGVHYRTGQERKWPSKNTMGAVWEDNCTRQALCRLKLSSGMMVVERVTLDILAGHLRQEDIPSVTPRTVRIYVCSTGADSKAERSAFVSVVYPKLREYCRDRYGLQFQVVDLMWGLTNDRLQADRDLMAMKVREIFRCQAMSLGPSFVAFIGQKYGEEALPITIYAEEFDVIRSALEVHRGRDTRNAPLLDQWYVRDDNNIPPVYVLKQTDEQLSEACTQKGDYSGKMSNEVRAAQHKELRQLLKRGAELAYLDGIIDSDTKYKYQTSELEQEMQHGIEHCDNPHRRCVLILRDIADLDNYLSDERTPAFTDVVYNSRTDRVEVEPEAAELLHRLRKRATGLISPRNTLVHDVLWRFEEVISPQLHKTYIDKLCNQVEDVLKRLIDEDASEHPTEAEQMPVAKEALQHWSRCKMAATDFCCHEGVRETMRVYVTGYSDRPLVVHGPVGSGKTTLVSNLALEVPDLVGNNFLCLLRYVGLTRSSSNIRKLMHSLCTQITVALGCLPGDIPSDISDLQRFFPKLLAAVPVNVTVVVILDAIDKILPDYDAHLMRWLPVHLPSHVKIIVTTLSNGHNIYHRLRNEILYGSNWFLHVEPLTPDAAQSLLQRFLHYFGRTLTKKQMLTFGMMLQKDSCPLHVRLLSEELKTVTSNMDTSTFCFPNACSEAIERVFDRLEARFGRLLVARCMAYSVASLTGLSDCEMEDLLSLDDGVLNEVYISHHPSVRRIPYLTWHQIRHEIQSFLLLREIDGMTVSTWEHSSFIDTIRARYLTSPDDVQHVHSMLADYFLGAWADRPKPVEASDHMPNSLDGILEDRRVPRQPLTFPESGGQETRFNTRKFEQLPRHLDLSGRHEDLNRLVLFNYDWLYHKTKAFSLHHVLADFELNPCEEANLVQEALQMAAPTIKCNADNLPAELSGRLLHYYATHPNIRSLINQCDTCGLKHCCLLPNFAYQQVPGSALQYTLHCPVACDFLGFAFDDRYLLSKKTDDNIVYVFDLLSGQLKDTIFASNGELHVTPNGQHLVIVDHVTEKSIKIHESGTGNFLSQVIVLNYLKVKVEGAYHAGPLSLSNDRLCAIVTTDTSFLCIANVPTGEVLEIAVLDGRATVCQITPDGRYVFCNSNEFLLSYDLYNLQHMTTVPVGYRPTSLVFTADSQRAFLAGPTEGKLLVVHTHDGVVEMCYKSVLQDALGDDPIRALGVSPDDNYVVIRCDYHVLVYNKGEERLKANFAKPVEVPEEFRLPNSGYRELIFTSAAFTRDSQGVIAALFRKIYIWDIGTTNLRVVIKTPIGIITKLLVSMRSNQLVTHVTKATDVHVWNVDAALRHLPVLDRLTDAVQELQITRRDTMVFVKCQNSDEVGVIDMRTGTLLDLLTHETKVRDFAVTPNGERALVCTVPRLSGTATKLWDVPGRRVIQEFGDSAGCCVSTHAINAILYISQSQPSFEAAYDISVYHFYGEQFTIRENPGACRFLRVKPQLTCDDRFLVLSSALGFDSPTGRYRSPCVVVFDVAAGMRRSCYDATSVGLEEVMDDIVAVQPCAQRECLVVVMISLRSSLDPSVTTMPNGEARSTSSSSRSSSRSQSTKHSLQQLGFFILDVSTGTITTMCLDLPPHPGTGPTLHPPLIFSSDFRLCLDSNAFLFEVDQGCVFRGQLPLPGTPKTFALGGAMMVYVVDEQQLVVVRVQDGCVLGRCEVHARICLLQLCADERTLLVGCANGTLISYVIADPLDGAIVRSSLGSLEGVAYRDVARDAEQKGILSRSWDKVEIASYPAYSRPPSALRPGSRDKEILQQIQPVPRVRPRSDTLLYLRKSQVCSVM